MSPNDKNKAVNEKTEVPQTAKDDEAKTTNRSAKDLQPFYAKQKNEEPKTTKRPAEDKKESSAKRFKDEEVLDVAKHPLGLKAGDRLEVEYEVVIGNDTKHHWWRATLLEHDGRTTEGIAIRTLQYEPYPDGGFPESSKEDVIFLRNDTLLDIQTQDELHFRYISSDNSAVMFVDGGRQGIEELVNNILISAMEKASEIWAALPRDQQAIMAEKVAEKKEKLVELLFSHLEENDNEPVTAEAVTDLLQRTMADE